MLCDVQEVTTPVGQYAYATAALLERRGLKEADRAPIKVRCRCCCHLKNCLLCCGPV
jgi:hypothetical protein